MKKHILLLISLVLAFSLCLVACGDKDEAVATETAEETINDGWEPIPEETPVVEEEPEEPEEEEEVVPEGMYRSELTNEIISEEIKDQRPIAAMVDNELTALPHYGINQADIVYELMNSTANDRITRLMVVVKDWNNVAQLGSIRSARPTNFMLAAEWNAILCHDGGPFYIDDWIARDYTNNLSGGFARVSNGKNTEFTEYIMPTEYTNTKKGKTYPGLGDRIDAAKYSRTYNEYYPGTHWLFAKGEVDLTSNEASSDALKVTMPFYHNSSELHYNEDTCSYDYYEYGEPHIDAADNNITSFKNVIIQCCYHAQLDENGYLIYNVIGNDVGFYLCNGKCIPITWVKESETAVTVFSDAKTGEQIELNTGNTYIAIVPQDTWGEVVITY